MAIYAFEGLQPVVHPTAYVHPEAILIGDVLVGARCYVGPGASLRGDMGRIVMGEGSNVQDNCTLHTFPGQDTVVEEDGHIGHGAVLHGCTISRNALVGMTSVIMDGAVVGEDSIVGAMSFVKAGFILPPRMLALGSPARAVRTLSAEELAWKIEGTQVYHHLAARSLETMRACPPLTAPESDRPRLPGGMTPLDQHRRGVPETGKK